MKWKKTSICVIMFLFLLVLNPIITGSYANKAKFVTSIISEKTSNGEKQLLEQNDIEYWGVFVCIADYNGTEHDLLIADEVLTMIPDELMTYGNWNEENMRVLVNDKAKATHILDGLDWLATVSDENDVVVFCYQGHGTELPDDDGDEPDGFDEAIVAWEVTIDGCITDDMLADKFDTMTADGIAIVLDCCLSDEFINKKADFLGVHRAEVFEGYELELLRDIETEKRIILTSAYGDGLSLCWPNVGSPTSFYLGDATNKSFPFFADGMLTVEEVFRFAQFETYFTYVFIPAYLSFVWGIFVGLQTVIGSIILGDMDLNLDFLKGFIGGLLFAFEFSILVIMLFELVAYDATGHLAIPLPQLYDSYPGTLPLGYG